MTRISIKWACAVVAMVVCAGGAQGQISINSASPPGEVGMQPQYSQQVVTGGTGSYNYVFLSLVSPRRPHSDCGWIVERRADRSYWPGMARRLR